MDKYVFGWRIRYKSNHISEDILQNARQKCDTIGDEAFVALERMCNTSDVDTLSQKFFALVTDGKPLDPALEALRVQMTTLPAWLSWDRIREGQSVFYKHVGSASFALLYFSLIGGFSAPKIVKVLDETAYLTSQNKDATWRRLNETLMMVLAVLESPESLQVGGAGWLAILRVRLLHSRVRVRILDSTKGWDARTFGLPLNQEDMMGTLLAFSANVLESIDRIALFGPYVQETRLNGLVSPVSQSEQEDYLHVWRWVGVLIGVHDEYNYCDDICRAKGAVESIVSHLLHPNDRSRVVAASVLSAVADRPPLRWSLAKHSQAARMLLGAPLSDALGIAFSFKHFIELSVAFMALAFTSWFVAPFLTPDSKYIARCRRVMRSSVERALGLTFNGIDECTDMGQFAATARMERAGAGLSAEEEEEKGKGVASAAAALSGGCPFA